jgi:hypothetical protein
MLIGKNVSSIVPSVMNLCMSATGKIMMIGMYAQYVSGFLTMKHGKTMRRTQMIIKREWTRGWGYKYRKYKGWFLFGFIPLYLIVSKG